MPREIFLWSVFYRSDKIIIIKILILWWPNYIMLNCSQVKKALSMKFLIQKQRISKNQWLEFPGKEIHIANFVKICCDQCLQQHKWYILHFSMSSTQCHRTTTIPILVYSISCTLLQQKHSYMYYLLIIILHRFIWPVCFFEGKIGIVSCLLCKA